MLFPFARSVMKDASPKRRADIARYTSRSWKLVPVKHDAKTWRDATDVQSRAESPCPMKTFMCHHAGFASWKAKNAPNCGLAKVANKTTRNTFLSLTMFVTFQAAIAKPSFPDNQTWTHLSYFPTTSSCTCRTSSIFKLPASPCRLRNWGSRAM